MLEKLSPEQLEAWKQKRRGLDTSIHTVLESTAQSVQHREGPLAQLLNATHVLHHHDPENPRRADRDAAAKPAALPKLHLRHQKHAA